MSTSKIAIASDHAGYELKTTLARLLAEMGHDIVDLGTESEESVDYPDFANEMADALKQDGVDKGVLVCGSGIGISIAANRHRHVRAAVCRTPEEAQLARQHNDANVLALGGRITDTETAKACLKAFLETEFEGGRHERRVKKMS